MPKKPSKKKKTQRHLVSRSSSKLRRSIAEHRPEFVRPESWRYVRLHPEWRKPKGLDNKVRKSIKGWPRRVKVGYRGPAQVRGYHSSGHIEVLVLQSGGPVEGRPGEGSRQDGRPGRGEEEGGDNEEGFGARA